LPAPAVQDFRQLLNEALDVRDDEGRKWSDAKWGCYAFYDYDGEPIYVGQTNERLRVRVQRHLTNQRTDAVAMRILDVFEVAELELWPLWQFESVTKESEQILRAEARAVLNAVEYNAYLQALRDSRFEAILNEKIPLVTEEAVLPPSRRFMLISDANRRERGHADTRIARRAETLSRLAAVAHERGEVSAGLRRVLVIQAVRLAYLSASRLAEVEGRAQPDPASIDVRGLVGSVLVERANPTADLDEDAGDGDGDIEE
jgi:hypothetical protein